MNKQQLNTRDTLRRAMSDVLAWANVFPTRQQRRMFIYDLAAEMREWADEDSRNEPRKALAAAKEGE